MAWSGTSWAIAEISVLLTRRLHPLDVARQHGVGACRDPKFNGGNEHRALMGLPEKIQHRRDRIAAGFHAPELAHRRL